MIGHGSGRFPALHNRRAAAAAVVAVVLAVAAIGAWILWSGDEAYRLSVRAPEPLAGGSESAPPELPFSVFSVPVEVELSRLIEVVEGALPQRFGSIDERVEIPGQDDLTAAYELVRGPLTASFEDSTATLGTTLSYRARAWYDPPILPEVSASCGTDEDEPMPRLSVSLVTPVTLDEDWRLRTRIRAGRIAPPTDTDRDRCRVTILNLDMTGQVIDAATEAIESHASRADSALAELDLRSDFAEWWNVIAKPIRLSDEVWLVLSPSALGRGPIQGAGGTLKTMLTLQARPRVVVSTEAPELEPLPLPPLRRIDGEPGLRILAEAKADFREVVALLEEEVVGRTIQAGDRTIVVREVRIQGVGDGRIFVAVHVTGDAEGELYLVGTPTYDSVEDRITVPDLDFDVASREAIVEGAAWIAHAGLVERLRERAQWPAAPAIEWARRQVETGFNSSLSPEVRLEGSVDTVSVIGVHAGRDALQVRAEVRGRATLVVEGG